MNLLLFPGNNPTQKKWITGIEHELAPDFANTYSFGYDHWETGQGEIDLGLEVTKLESVAKTLEPYIVFAKSVGSMVTLQAMNKLSSAGDAILEPKSCLFVGLPLRMIESCNLPVLRWLESSRVPITILQNELDPLGSHNELLVFLSDSVLRNVSAHMLIGDTHAYDDVAAIKKYL